MYPDSEIGVYTDQPTPEPRQLCVGTLRFYRRSHSSAGFEYSREWLSHPCAYELEPGLPLTSGAHYTRHPLFGSIGDSAPDRWGRRLIERAHRMGTPGFAQRSGALFEADYLLGVSDAARMGALRYSTDGGRTFHLSGAGAEVPPVIDLLPLQNAARKICDDVAGPREWNMLLSPGSSLGGAWPKATVRDEQGHLYIAKFSRSGQEYDVVAWEAVAMELARAAGLQVAACSLKRPARGKSVFLARRFDRAEHGARIPYISAMTLMQCRDGDSRSYLELAEHISQFSCSPETDLRELWRRIAFSIMITNTDDHARNHGFLRRESRGWQLSPVFDLNPTPAQRQGHTLSMGIEPGNHEASLSLLKSYAGEFYVRKSEANALLAGIARAVAQWQVVARRLGIPAAEQAELRSAFEHENGFAAALHS